MARQAADAPRIFWTGSQFAEMGYSGTPNGRTLRCRTRILALWYARRYAAGRYAPPQHHIMELSALTTVPRFYGAYWAEPAAQPLRVKPAFQPFYDMSTDFGKNERCDLYGPRSMLGIIQGKTRALAAAGNRHPHVYFMAWHEFRPADVAPYGHFVKSIAMGNLYQVDL